MSTFWLTHEETDVGNAEHVWLARRAERPVENFPRRNGAFIEPLHHRAYPRHSRSDFRPRKLL